MIGSQTQAADRNTVCGWPCLHISLQFRLAMIRAFNSVLLGSEVTNEGKISNGYYFDFQFLLIFDLPTSLPVEKVWKNL